MFKKIFSILPSNYKKKSILFVFFLTIATFLETLSVGIILPLLEYIVNGNFSKNTFGINFGNILNTQNNPSAIKNLIAIIIILYFFKSVYLLYFNFWQLKFSQNVFKTLSCNLLNNYFSKPISFYYKKNSSEIMRNILFECRLFGQTISILLKLIVEVILVIFLLSLVIYIEPLKTLVITISLLILSLTYYLLTKNKIYEFGVDKLKSSGAQIKILNESLGSIKEIKLKSSENFFLNLYEKITQKFIFATYFQQFIVEAPRVIFEFIFIFVLLSGLLFYMTFNEDLNNLLPILGLYVIAAYRLIPSVMKIMNFVQQIKGSKPNINVLFAEFKNVKKVKNQIVLSKNEISFKKSINFFDISFSYDGKKKIFENFSEKINRNEYIGIIGKTGSGKSTFVDLVTGLIKPEKGSVKVDGIDVNKISKNWQNKIGYVPQSVFLLDSTVKENVAFGIEEEKINSQNVIKCLKHAQIDQYVKNLDNGIESLVGERGVQLSGGQRQRIGIARELYKDPEILILDEATSALDEKTEKDLLEDLNRFKGKKTIIIISHRESTLKNCDRIINLNSI